jgi:hypothetical protein
MTLKVVLPGLGLGYPDGVGKPTTLNMIYERDALE